MHGDPPPQDPGKYGHGTHPHSLPTRPEQSSQRHTPYTHYLQDLHKAQSHTLHTLCLQDPHEAWSLVRHTPHTLSAYKTCTKHNQRHTLHTLPTRPARSMVAGQRHTPHTLSAYKTRTKHGRRSETHTPHTLCLQDPHKAWSPSQTHTLHTHGHRSETHTPHTLCLQDPHEARSPVRDTYPTHSLPTRSTLSIFALKAWSLVDVHHFVYKLQTSPDPQRHTHTIIVQLSPTDRQ